MTELTPQLWFNRCATSYVVAQLVYQLNRAGVFRELSTGGGQTADELARRLGLRVEVLACVLDYLAAVEQLIAKQDARFVLTEFGRAVLARFARTTADGVTYNLFDTRVGAYAPVWTRLDDLLRGQVYGDGLHRAGEEAAGAAYKLSLRFLPSLQELVDRLRVTTLVELGCSSGLLERVGRPRPDLALCGVDRAPGALARARAHAEAEGVTRARWLTADVFAPETWTDELAPGGLLFSVHLHEFLACGEPAWRSLLGSLGRRLRGWRMVVFEQPRIPDAARAEVSEDVWLNNQSNVLIHHLIGKGKILTLEQLVDLFERSGCPIEAVDDLNFLGYHALVARIGTSS